MEYIWVIAYAVGVIMGIGVCRLFWKFNSHGTIKVLHSDGEPMLFLEVTEDDIAMLSTATSVTFNVKHVMKQIPQK